MDALRPLSLDQFAAMTAEMESGFPRDRVLADAGVSAEQWELTQETWLLRMAKQGQQRKLALLDRYNELLAKHRKAAQRKMRAEKRKLKGPMPVAPEVHVAPLARAFAEDAAGATFQQQGVATAPGAAWSVTSSGPGVQGPPAGAAPPVVAMPAMVTPPPVAAPSMFAAPSMLAADDLDETDDAGEGGTIVGAAVDMSAAPAWLEANRAAAEPHAGPAWMAPKQPPSALSSTARVDNIPLPAAGIAGPAWLAAKPPPRADEPRVAAPPTAAAPAAGPAWLNSSASFSTPLPASPPAGDGHAAARAQAPAAAPDAPPPKRPTKGATLIDQKMSDFMPPAASGPAWLAQGAAKPTADAASPRPGAAVADALPFQRGAQQPAPPPAAQPAAAGPARDALPFQRSAQPAAAPPAPAQAQPAGGAVPAAKPSAPAGLNTAAAPGPRLSIEQLAWLQAQVETSAELGRAAREKLGLSEAEYAGERAFWQTRFQQDRATVERYSQLFYHYKRGR